MAVEFHTVGNLALTVVVLDTAGRQAAGNTQKVVDPGAAWAAGIEEPDTAVAVDTVAAGIGVGCSPQAEYHHKTPGGTCPRTFGRR